MRVRSSALVVFSARCGNRAKRSRRPSQVPTRAACSQLSVTCTGWPAARTCRRRTVLGKRSHGAARKRFPGERRTLTCSLHETKYQVDRARHDGHKLDRVRSSRPAYPQLCLHATVALPVGSWLCPLEKKCDVRQSPRPHSTGVLCRMSVVSAFFNGFGEQSC